MAKDYIVSENGTAFDKEINPKVMAVLDSLIKSKNRIRLWYGDRVTGRSWNDEYNVTGHVSRSTGQFKIPLLIHNERSWGGGAILDSSIVKIVDIKTKRVLFQHEKFHQETFTVVTPSDLSGYVANVLADGTMYARCRTLKGAERLADFMNGKRMAK